jgi:hypothetical protein
MDRKKRRLGAWAKRPDKKAKSLLNAVRRRVRDVAPPRGAHRGPGSLCIHSARVAQLPKLFDEAGASSLVVILRYEYAKGQACPVKYKYELGSAGPIAAVVERLRIVPTLLSVLHAVRQTFFSCLLTRC